MMPDKVHKTYYITVFYKHLKTLSLGTTNLQRKMFGHWDIYIYKSKMNHGNVEKKI